MTIPGSPTLEGAPYGAQPVVQVIGPQGGPYTVRGPKPVSVLPSAARTATVSSAVQANPGYKGLLLSALVTVNPGGAQTLTISLVSVDSLSAQETVLLTVPASASPTGSWMVYPGLSGAAVESVLLTRNLVLPSQWYVRVTHSGVGSWTYQVTAELLP